MSKDQSAEEVISEDRTTDETKDPKDKKPSLTKNEITSSEVDPFKSFIAEQEAVEEKKKKKPKTYLETLDLSQLVLSAIILSPKGNWAMVEDAKGLGHVIRKGTPIGTNGGVVFQIKEKEVLIHESFKDYRGQDITRTVAKKMPSLE